MSKCGKGKKNAAFGWNHFYAIICYIVFLNRFIFTSQKAFNSSPPGQNGRHFADDLLRCIFVNEKCGILIRIALTFVSNNKPALILIMAWRRIGDKPLSERMLTRFTNVYMRHSGEKNFKLTKVAYSIEVALTRSHWIHGCESRSYVNIYSILMCTVMPPHHLLIRSTTTSYYHNQFGSIKA